MLKVTGLVKSTGNTAVAALWLLKEVSGQAAIVAKLDPAC